MNGAESLVRTLVASDVDVCFTNPGTSEMHFVAALDRVPGMRCVLGLFEGVVTGAADGYWRIAGKPAATLLHLGPGLANGLANLHNAKKARSGIVNIVGEHATHHRDLGAPLASDIEGIARPMSHWVHTTRTADDVAADGRNAVAQAISPPGRIATLVLPADTAWNETSTPPITGPVTPAALAPVASSDTVRRIASSMKDGLPTVLLLGGNALTQTALTAAGRVARATGCTLLSEFSIARVERGAGRVAAPRLPYAVEPALAALAPFKRIVLVGTQPPVAFFAYPGKPGRLAPEGCDVVSLAGKDDDAAASLDALVAELGAGALEPAGVAQRTAAGAVPVGPMTTEGIARVLAARIPENAIIVDESVSSGRAFGVPTAGAAPHDWLTGVGGSIGFGLPVALGAAIAAPHRKVISLESDGSGMYTPQALWSMAREGLDVTVLVFANRAYKILLGEFAGVGGGSPGPRANDMLTLDRPTLDWVALARGMGIEASRATDLGELDIQLARALSQRGPVLIEMVL